MLRASPVRVLDDRDAEAVLGLLEREPVENVFVASRIEAAGLSPWRLGAEVWGYHGDGGLSAVCYSGANLVPAGAGPDALTAFADRARRQGRRCSSIFGAAGEVLALWEQLGPQWGQAREIRRCQPLLVTERLPACPLDAAVRRVRPDEVDLLLPACVAMFTEEVGVSPLARDGGALYRARIAELVAAGRAFARIEEGQVLFKAEVGAATGQACQIQGVWVRPELRGHGLGTAGTASVVASCLRDVAPVASLYVNDFNQPARRAYAQVGFRQQSTFASVLF